jgi:hypothetical protein
MHPEYRCRHAAGQGDPNLLVMPRVRDSARSKYRRFWSSPCLLVMTLRVGPSFGWPTLAAVLSHPQPLVLPTLLANTARQVSGLGPVIEVIPGVAVRVASRAADQAPMILTLRYRRVCPSWDGWKQASVLVLGQLGLRAFLAHRLHHRRGSPRRRLCGVQILPLPRDRGM